MCKTEEELQTPPKIIKTIDTLAPKGSPLKQTIAAIQLAVDLYQAKPTPPLVQQEHKSSPA